MTVLNTELPYHNSKYYDFVVNGIKSAAHAASTVKQIYTKGNYKTYSKGEQNEPLTDADLQSNKILENHLATTNNDSKNTGRAPIVSEEGKTSKEKPKDNSTDLCWIIDPLDGTQDFVNNTGDFTIMAGLLKDTTPVAGIIACPMLDTIFFAEKGMGCYKTKGIPFERFYDNNKENDPNETIDLSQNQKSCTRIQTSKTTNLSDCSATVSRFHISQKDQDLLDKLGIKRFVKRGSSLKAASIAQGEAEVYFSVSSKMKLWDTAASHCIIEQAGGKMTDLYGNSLSYDSQNINHENGILATNGTRIHEDVVQAFAKLSGE